MAQTQRLGPARALAAAAMILLATACGDDDLIAPTTGEIAVTVSTTGDEPDPDGYALELDGLRAATIGLNESLSFERGEGEHVLELVGVAPNCGVTDGAHRVVEVVGGQTTAVTFEVTCGASTGGLRVTTTTAGEVLDPDGYLVIVNQGAPQPIEVNGVLAVGGLSPGDHTVQLSGIAENCAVTGDNPRTAAVQPGGFTEVSFEITCRPVTGGLQVVIVTTGDLTDPDGYTIRLNAGEPQRVETNVTLTLGELPAGDQTIELADLAAECELAGENPRTVTVAAGETVETRFEVFCTAGVQQWTPMASGTRADLPDVWGSSATDVFVVGEENIENGELETASVIRHYDGTAWGQQLREVDLILRGVWGSSSSDVFAVGWELVSPRARVLHFDGSGWTDMLTPTPEDGEEFALESVWGSSATDVFAVGSLFFGPFQETLILHFDGSGWRRMEVEGDLRPWLVDVWGSSATDVYAVGRQSGPSPGVILRFDGARWSPVLELEGFAPTSIWGSSATDVFVAGFQVRGGSATGAILHYDGTTWSPLTLPRSGVLHEVWGSSSRSVFAVGDDGIILHFNGTGWTGTNPTRNTLLGVWGSSRSDVFAVGTAGTILHGTP